MKTASMIAGVLFLVNFTSASAQEQQPQIVNLMNTDYTLVSAELDQNRFSANNVLISLENVSDSSLTLRIINNICPKVPGKVSCMAMPFPMFIGEFKLGKAKVDNCGARIMKSDVVMYNGERAQITVKDYRAMLCEMVYLADLEITLKTKNGAKRSVSTLLLNHKDITDMPHIPNIKPELPILPHIPVNVKSFYSTSVIEKSGDFFTGYDDLAAYVSVDTEAKKMNLEVSFNPCSNLLCEAISAYLIQRDLDLTSVKSNKCNEKTYDSSEVSVYDVYPAVLGAVRTYVQVEIIDSRHSVCDQNGGMVYALVTVTRRQNIIQDLVVGVSTATFNLNQIGLE